MRSGFSVLLIVAVLFGGGYFYYIAEAVCPVPLSYRIGTLDERFGLSEEAAQLAVAGAEGVWEDATGRNLFTYDEAADFTINFVFDERQALADAEEDFKDRLDQTEGMNEEIAKKYEQLVAEYKLLKDVYSKTVSAYETELAAYNEKVETYNRAGGAPPKEYAALEKTKIELDKERNKLNTQAKNLNALVVEINKVGSEGNRIIETYNQGVETYNQTFGEPREFTQGDYQGELINIYTFADTNELELVLTHELGHALHLGHVANSKSVMYYLIGDQDRDITLTTEDLDEFNHVCGTGAGSFLERLKISLGIY